MYKSIINVQQHCCVKSLSVFGTASIFLRLVKGDEENRGVRGEEVVVLCCWGYLGDKGAAVGKEAEFLGELKGEVGERRRGLPSRSPLCSFHSSSSFSMDRRLLTLDSFCSVCWSLACSEDSCLQGETESCSGLQGHAVAIWVHHQVKNIFKERTELGFYYQ